MTTPIGGLSNNGAVPKKNSYLSTLSIPSAPGTQVSNPLGGGSSKVTQVSPGIIPQPPQMKDVSTPPVINVGGKSQIMKGSPSVLAQQRELNKLGAGLVEDGIAGEKTKAAIAKYGVGATTTAAKPTGTTPGILPTPKPTTPAPAPLTIAGQVPGLLQSGQQTENERQTQTNLQNAGKITDWEEQARNTPEVQKAIKDLADFKIKVAQAYADIDNDTIPLEFKQGRQQVLQRQAAQQQAALESAVSNALTSQGQQLSAAGTQAARGATTAGQAYTGSQTQASRATGVAGTALGAVAPIVGVSQGTRDVLPGQMTSTSSGSDASGLLKGSAAGLIPKYYDEYTQAQSSIDNISKNEQLFNNLLSTAKVNPTDLTPINEVLQRVGQLTSSADYANFQNLIASLRSNYAQLQVGRGLTPTDAGDMAQRLLPDNAKIETINSVLNYLKKEGQNYLSSKADQLKRAQDTFSTGTAPDTSTPSGSSTGGSIWDF